MKAHELVTAIRQGHRVKAKKLTGLCSCWKLASNCLGVRDSDGKEKNLDILEFWDLSLT